MKTREGKLTRKVDYTGKEFEVCRVVRFLGFEFNGYRQLYECIDIFGNMYILSSNILRRPGFGSYFHCDESRKRNRKLVQVYNNMMHRCYNPKDSHYRTYGGRGITVCTQWRFSYPEFRAWAIKCGWEPGLCVDRKNNDGPYTPDNCRIITVKENSRNRTNTKLTAKIVNRIRKRAEQSAVSGYVLYRKEAEKYGVSEEHVRNIVLGKTWK